MARPKGPTATVAHRQFARAREAWARGEISATEFGWAAADLLRWDEEHGHVSPDGLTNLPDFEELPDPPGKRETFFEWAERVDPPVEPAYPVVKIETKPFPHAKRCMKCAGRHRWWSDVAVAFGHPHELVVEDGVAHWSGVTGILCASRDSSGLT